MGRYMDVTPGEYRQGLLRDIGTGVNEGLMIRLKQKLDDQKRKQDQEDALVLLQAKAKQDLIGSRLGMKDDILLSREKAKQDMVQSRIGQKDAIQLAREKARIEQSSPLGSLDIMTKLRTLDPSGRLLRDYAQNGAQANAQSIPQASTQGAILGSQMPNGYKPKEYKLDPMTGGYYADTLKSADELSPFLQAKKDKRTEDLISMLENNPAKRKLLQEAEVSAPKIPGGILGKMRRVGAELFNPNDPLLSDIQKVKMVLTDAQLLNTAKTKGAISDREMELFATAAANNDIPSLQKMKPVFDKLKMFIDADENAAVKSYQSMYPDEGDPRALIGGSVLGQQTTEIDNQEPSEEDIQYTMQKHGLTREEVLRRLGGQ